MVAINFKQTKVPPDKPEICSAYICQQKKGQEHRNNKGRMKGNFGRVMEQKFLFNNAKREITLQHFGAETRCMTE